MKPLVFAVMTCVTAAAAPVGFAAAQGSVTGTVKFAGTPPANPQIDMSAEAVCVGANTVDPVVRVSGGNLADVAVYVKSGLPAGQAVTPPTEPAVLDQQGCLYVPRTVAVMVKQPLEIRNSDAVLHNVKAIPTQNRGFNVSQPMKGMKSTRTFATAEVAIPLRCNVHGWMHANVLVLDHPYFAVTGADGSFTLTGLPPGSYVLEAWHEKLGTQTLNVTVPAAGSANVIFTFKSQ